VTPRVSGATLLRTVFSIVRARKTSDRGREASRYYKAPVGTGAPQV